MRFPLWPFVVIELAAAAVTNNLWLRIIFIVFAVGLLVISWRERKQDGHLDT